MKSSSDLWAQPPDGQTPAAAWPGSGIADLGLLSDRRTAALVTRWGEIVWYCPDRFHAPALLARLLDEARGGSWQVVVPGAEPSGRQYLGETGVLETCLRAGDGELTITDFMPLGEDLPRGLCRVFSPAPCRWRLVLHAAPDYARLDSAPTPDGPAIHVGQGQVLYTSHPAHVEGQQVVVDLPPHEAAWAFLSDGHLPGEAATRLDGERMTQWCKQTRKAWDAVTTYTTDHGPYQEAVRASLRALRLLTDHGSGGVVAAPTTSLPEVLGGSLNWDYRYVWLRDAGMVVSALTRAGGDGREGRRFLDFVCSASPGDHELPLPPFLTSDGQVAPPEITLDLSGYRDSWPVRVGNGARHQMQLDAYGNVLLAAKLIYERYGTRDHWPVVARLADFLAAHWHEDDYGIWEERTRRPYVAGKVLAACALEHIAPFSPDAQQQARWRGAAQAIRLWVERRGRTSEGAYAYVAGREGVDLTAALFPIWGYCPPDSPEMLATLHVLERDYSHSDLYWRHLEGETKRREGVFLAGTFWIAQYWTMRDPVRAQRILDAGLRVANDLGLLPEEADPATGEPLGNFPQTFVHAALIGAVLDLREALEQAGSPNTEHFTNPQDGLHVPYAAPVKLTNIGGVMAEQQQEQKVTPLPEPQDFRGRGRLEGKVAVVTGSDSGIGQAIAAEFAREGADVVITYHQDKAGAEETCRQVEAEGRRALVVQLDQTQESSVAQLFERTVAELGTPFILVNDAGRDSTGKQVAEVDPKEWENVIRTNLLGPFYCCQHFIRLRRGAGGRGKIINVTSVHEEIPRVGASGYDASKGGLRNLTRTLALELAPDLINVNNLAPGMVLTPMNQEAIDDPKVYAEQVQSIPFKRAALPWEMARLAVYLASPDADYATGTTFTLDGGLMQNQGQGA